MEPQRQPPVWVEGMDGSLILAGLDFHSDRTRTRAGARFTEEPHDRNPASTFPLVGSPDARVERCTTMLIQPWVLLHYPSWSLAGGSGARYAPISDRDAFRQTSFGPAQ